MLNVLQRAFNSKLQTVSATAGEKSTLEAQGIQNPILQSYFAWRRSLMIVVVIATALSAGLSTYRWYSDDDDGPDVVDTIFAQVSKSATAIVPAAVDLGLEKSGVAVPNSAQKLLAALAANQVGNKEDESEDDPENKPKTILSQFDDLVHLTAIYLLALAALAGLFWWTRLNFTFRIMLGVFAFSFLVPIVMAFLPWSWWDGEAAVESDATTPFGKFERLADGLKEALGYVSMLFPAVLSMLPGVQKACVRVKTLLPQSVLPGWFLVAAAPFYALFLLVIFVAVYQVFSSPLVLIGMFLIIASSLIYGIRTDVFTRPLHSDSDFQKLYGVQRMAGVMTAVAGVLLLYYITTQDFLGIHLFGLDPKTTLLQPMDLAEFFLEIIARSMFMTVFGADLFMQINLADWKNHRDFKDSAAAQQYDDTMSAMAQIA